MSREIALVGFVIGCVPGAPKGRQKKCMEKRQKVKPIASFFVLWRNSTNRKAPIRDWQD